jgi:hypothetical protein
VVAVVSTRPVQQPPEDEISRLFALMMPERAAKSPRAVAATRPGNAVTQSDRITGHGRREPTERAEAARDCEAQERAALLAAIAADRARQRRRDVAIHALLVAVFCVVALVLVGAKLARLLLPLAMARGDTRAITKKRSKHKVFLVSFRRAYEHNAGRSGD